MLAYIIKRLISGFVVILLVSLSVFLLFFYGPSSPAQPICDRDTGNRCTPERLATFERNLGFDNPWYEEYGKFMKGIVAGREVQFGNATIYECPAPCLGYSYRTKVPVFEEMKERMPATFSVAIGGASSTSSSASPSASQLPEDAARSPTRHWCRASW
jgi:peptide/nickel transport system permease protein